MTDAEVLLQDLRAKSVRLWVEGEDVLYEAPEGAMDGAALARLQSCLPDLLDLLDKGAQVEAQDKHSAPASASQEGLWVLDQLGSAGNMYLLHALRELHGPLDVGALERALDELYARHESLRTRFAEVDGRPVQIIAPRGGTALALVDLSSLRDEAREARLRESIAEEGDKTFDLSRGPLLRAKLIRLSATRHVFLLVMHHIISDEWSMAIFYRELSALYAAFANGLPSPLVSPPPQFAPFARAQRRHLESGGFEAGLAYWKRHLEGAPAAVELPCRLPRAPMTSNRGASFRFDIRDSDSDALAELARNARVTLYTVLLTAFQVFLARLSAENDVVVGSPVTGRVEGSEDVIGYFVNMLPFRLEVDAGRSFRELVRTNHAQILAAHDHQDVPFTRIAAAAGQARGETHPLFNVTFTFLGQQPDTFDLAGVSAKPYGGWRQGAAKFDLSLFLSMTSTGLAGAFEYSPDVLDVRTADMVAESFASFLGGLAANPDAAVSSVPLLERAHWQGEIVQRNATTTDYPRERTLVELFTEHATRSPESIAAMSLAEQLTYRELDIRSNRLGRYLRERGVYPGAAVAVFLSSSVHVAVAVLGVLKAGAVYLPLDPAAPVDRLAFMLNDADVRIVLTETSLEDDLPAGWAVPLSIDREWSSIGERSATDEAARLSPDDLAYIIYTSGSTGQPKGVCITHRNVCRLVRGTNFAEFHRDDAILQMSSLAFDAAIFEVWGALANGGRIVFVDRDTVLDAEALSRTLTSHRITKLFATTTLFNRLALDAPAVFASVEQVLTGGEAADPTALAAVLAAAPPRILTNGYGPTEGTTFTTFHHITSAPDPMLPVSIGRALSNTSVYVLDEGLSPVPVGVGGELYIGGDGLARGYLHRPGLSAASFIADPFAAPGSRMYRSGDLARWNWQGELEFLGRIDQQVKIRGFRIELGEVEAALASHSQVGRAVVVARQDRPGEKQLVAYVVAAAGGIVSAPELRSHLKDRLPDYMIPAAFVALAELPLTRNGKLDRDALPKPDLRAAMQSPYVAASSPVERTLARIWADVLGLERVGIDDNFFELGGDSITALRIRGEGKKNGLDFAVADVFRTPTISALGRQVKLAASERDDKPQAFDLLEARDAVRARDAGFEDAYPLSMLQLGMIFHNIWSEETSTYHAVMNQSVALRLDEACFRAAVERAVARHSVLRTTFNMTDYAVPVQCVHRSLAPCIETVDLASPDPGETEAGLRELVRREARSPIDLARGPLVKYIAAATGEASFALVLSFHHAMMDGWSDAALMTEIIERYAALLRREPQADDAAPEVSYRDFIAQERTALEDPVHRRYWEGVLDDIADGAGNAALSAADERPRMTAREEHLYRRTAIDAETGKALVDFARRSEVPVKSAFIAAHANVLRLLFGQSDLIASGLVCNARPEHADGDKTLGLFLNTVPLRFKAGDGSWSDLAQRALRAEQELLPHRAYPAVSLYRRRPGRDPFAAVFNFVNFHVLGRLQGQVEIKEGFGVADTNFPWDVDVKFDSRSGTGVLAVSCAAERYPKEMLDQYIEMFLNSLRGMTLSPRERFRRWNVLPARDLKLLELSSGPASNADRGSIVELIRSQAERTPKAAAVIDGARSFDYAELESRSNRLAHHLRRRGVRAEQTVAICMERSPEMIVAKLAILKAGAAFLPLERRTTLPRLAFMIEDAGVVLALSDATTRDLVCGLEIDRVDLDADVAEIAREPAEALDMRLDRENLACVMYTSGSTGQPKGVAVRHAALANHARFFVAKLAVNPGDCILQHSAGSFDASLSEIFPPLIAGASLMLAPWSEEGDVDGWKDVLGRGVTILLLTPSYLDALLEGGAFASAPSLRAIISGGEALSSATVRNLQRTIPVELYNGFGPTETTIESVMAHVTSATSPVSIGRALSNTSVYVLDEGLSPVPVGVGGELYIGGDGLARGYLHRPGLSAASFIADPFAAPGSRMYRSGDLARWNWQGELEFLGRIDQQVKIRGFRIELGEVEAALASHSQVGRAVVVARQDRPGEKQLVAYVVAAAGGIVSAPELRSHLKDRLPDYMIPAAFVALAELPLTRNGKLDRDALPKPDLRAAMQSLYVAASSPVERTLARIWADVLGLERVGIDDNFFELGGDSITALRICYRAASQLSCAVPTGLLFSEATVGRMAARLRSAAGVSSLPFRLPLKRSPHSAHEIVVLPTILGTGTYFADFAKRFPADVAVTALRLPGTQDDEQPLETMEALAEHCLNELAHDLGSREITILGWSFGGVLGFELARRMEGSGLRVPRTIIVDSVLRPDATRSDAASDLQMFEALLGRLRDDLAKASGGEFGVAAESQADRQRSALFRTFCANLAALRSYRPDALEGPLIQLMTPQTRQLLETDGKYRPLPARNCLAIEIEGDHYSIFQGENATSLATIANQLLRDRGNTGA